MENLDVNKKTNIALENFTNKELYNILSKYYLLGDTTIEQMVLLGFTGKQILKNIVDIKHLLELFDNNLGIEFISFDKLQEVVKNNNGDLTLIKKELKKNIDINGFGLRGKVLLLSILNHGINNI